MMRSGYTAEVRPFVDSDVTAKIKWVRCNPGVPVLGIPNRINPLRWEGFPYLAGGVGEVFNEPQPFDPGRPIPGALGVKVCGTPEEFAGGAVYDPDATPVGYSPEGLAQCCASPPGGVVLGGSAYVPTQFGVVIGGEQPPLIFAGPACTLLGGFELMPVNGVEYLVPYKFVSGGSFASSWVPIDGPAGQTVDYHYRGSQPGDFALASLYGGLNGCGLLTYLGGGPANGEWTIRVPPQAAQTMYIAVEDTGGAEEPLPFWARATVVPP